MKYQKENNSLNYYVKMLVFGIFIEQSWFIHFLKYDGSLPGFHLILHPMLGFWSGLTGRSVNTASMAALRSRPVRGLSFPGRLSSSCPRYTRRLLASKRKKSGVHAAV